MGAIDSLTRFFDNLKGAQNTYHASSMTDEQRQKMYDDRAKSLSKAYDSEYSPDDYRFQDAKNGTFFDGIYEFMTPDDPTVRGKFNTNSDINPNTGYSNVAYDMQYKMPSGDDGGYYGNDTTTQTGGNYGNMRIFMRMPAGANSADYGLYDPLSDSSVGVYGAVLDDGTTLSPEELREFLKINKMQNGYQGSLKKASFGGYDTMGEGYDAYANSMQKKYNDWLSNQYANYNAVDARQYGSYEDYLDALNGAKPVVPRWDKNSRSWRTW